MRLGQPDIIVQVILSENGCSGSDCFIEEGNEKVEALKPKQYYVVVQKNYLQPGLRKFIGCFRHMDSDKGILLR